MTRITLFIFSFFVLTACNSSNSETTVVEKEAPKANDAIEVATQNSEVQEPIVAEVSPANNTTPETTTTEIVDLKITETIEATPETISPENNKEVLENIDTTSNGINKTTTSLTQTIAEYQAENTQDKTLSCNAENPLDLSLSIENLNNLSQQVFALNDTSSINSYANFIALSQLALTGREHTAALIEQLGLAQLTQNKDWFDSFCLLEKQLMAITTQVNLANDWQVNKSFLTELNQYFPVTFTERKIDPTKDLWRLSMTNNWLVEIPLTVIAHDYIHYQAINSGDIEIAKAIMITGKIATAGNKKGDYIRILDSSSNTTINIIIPTFDQYNIVKENLIDTLNSFKGLEQKQLEKVLIPYFATNVATDSFFKIKNWINHNNLNDIFDEEGQNFSGINTIEDFRLFLTNNTDEFSFDSTGKIKAQSTTELSYEALRYIGEAFQPAVPHSSNVTLTSSNVSGIPISLCNVKLVAQKKYWRPYFILIENSDNGLIYTMTKSETPVIEDQSNLCSEDIFSIKTIND